MSAPTVQSVEDIINELNPAYQGQVNVLNERRAQIPGMFQAQRSGLEAAKVQGFNQINNQATGRGMSFSGIPLDEQANYLSTKYLPGMQQLAQQENEQRSSLDEALSRIDSERRLRAMDVRTDQQKRLESYLAEQRQMAFEREKMARQEAMERQRMAQSAAAERRAAGPTITKNKNNGWDVSDGYDLAGYARATGTDLITLLSQGDAQDQKAAKYYRDNIRLGRGEAYAMDRLMNYDRKTAFYRGG